MTTCTPIYRIPVVEGSDDPCDIGDTLCAIAEATETQLDILDALVGRTATTIPMLKVAVTIPVTYTLSSPLFSFPAVFDTVIVDTDNMFNASFPSVITFNTPGTWLFTVNQWVTSTGAGGIQLSQGLSVSLSAPPIPTWPTARATNATLNFPSPLNTYINGSAAFPVYSPQDGFATVSVFPNGTDTLTIIYADVGLVWLGDLS